ncbi:MAG: 1,4-dihydroxy-2-naphthoate polyprenyltransferase [Salibacter sp.]|uniref:1,4-dihydroxy-2-naphthoate polyprenyltransferase n=1 Tax=Salibacter sp. TaxID=2010995 RepID=UPI0028703241|nr:1,4-dihydroxy-2-naphthoate polyprenyltransferase [Salibacter sp.]MDR9398727.1 1,4-dihydroxy-2-naphthoate polyprenyltransferase [Salibacter sp.]
MATIQNWISTFRLRTLPLALSVIILGSLLAYANGFKNYVVTLLAVLTTLFLQILSNVANDYGDGVKGTDNDERIGPQRAIQSGAIGQSAMKMAVIILSLLAFISGISLILFAIPSSELLKAAVFLILGLVSIWAAIKYTVGKDAYGYRGMGDLFVFIFFGLVGVCGTFYLHANELPLDIFLPASAIGFLSTGVLNLNNMRDFNSDKNAGKNTLVVNIGLKTAKRYHTTLLIGALILSIVYVFLNSGIEWSSYLFLLVSPLVIFNLKKVFQIKDPKQLDPLLKQLAITTLLYSILLGIGQLL